MGSIGYNSVFWFFWFVESYSIYIILIGGEDAFLAQANKSQIGTSHRQSTKVAPSVLGIDERQKFETEIAQLKVLVQQLKNGNGGVNAQPVKVITVVAASTHGADV